MRNIQDPPVAVGPISAPGSIVPAVLFFAALIALPGFAWSSWLAGPVALSSAVISTVLIVRRAPHRGLQVAALSLGSVGIVVWILSLLLMPAGMAGTVTMTY